MLTIRHGFRTLALATLIATACTPASTPVSPTAAPSTGGQAQPTTAPAPKQFKLNVGTSASVSNLDPHAFIGTNLRRWGMFEALISQDENAKMIPGLATEWKNLDATTWQFKLAQGRKFHDNSPVTAEDVKWSLEHAADPTLKLGITTRAGNIKEAQIVDPQTVNVVAKSADPTLLYAVLAVAILPKAYYAKVGPEEFSLKPIGTGPFKLQQFIPNDRAVLVPFDGYPTKTAVSELNIRFVTEASARVAGLKTGELDIIDNVPLDQVDLLKSNYQTINFNQGLDIGAFIFTEVPGPTQNKLIRQALNYAVDKETLAKTVYHGLTKPSAGQVVSSNAVGYNPNLKAYPYDPAKAKQLMAQAGYPNGFSTKVSLASFVFEGESAWLLIQSQWKEVGINLDIVRYSDAAQFLDRWYGRVAREPLLSTQLQSRPTLDASTALVWFRGDASEPQRFYQNPAFDKAWQAAATEMDPKKRADDLAQASAALYEDPAYLFLIEGFQIWMASPKLNNIVARADGDPVYSIITQK